MATTEKKKGQAPNSKGASKLAAKQQAELVRMSKRPDVKQRDLAEKFGVSESYVSRLLKQKGVKMAGRIAETIGKLIDQGKTVEQIMRATGYERGQVQNAIYRRRAKEA